MALSPFLGGKLAFYGMLAGLIATSFSLLALWWVIGIVARPVQAPQEPWWRTVFIVFCFLLKVPILGGAMMLVRSLGEPAPTHFLYGLALVYFALVGWFLSNREPA